MTVNKTDRKKALDDGLQKDITDVSKEAGLFLPVFITNKVWDFWITSEEDNNISEEDKARIKGLISKLVYSLRVHRQTSKSNLIYFSVSLEKDGENETVLLLSYLGPIDSEDQRPCITIMLPEEYPAESKNA